MATYWVPDLPDIQGFAGHLLHYILIFANGASSAWCCMHINTLCPIFCLGKSFSSLWLPRTLNQVQGDWKRVSYHGSRRCVDCITISLPTWSCLLACTYLFVQLLEFIEPCWIVIWLVLCRFFCFSQVGAVKTCRWFGSVKEPLDLEVHVQLVSFFLFSNPFAN